MVKLLRLGLLAEVVIMVFSALSATAQGLPPPDMLDAIFPVLRHKAPPGLPTLSSFTRSSDRSVDAACGLSPIDLIQTTGSDKYVFKLLGQPQSENNSEPSSMLIGLSRVAVNADGSRRAYHPDDPFGLCKSQTAATACALDVLGDAEIHVYRGSERIPQFKVFPGQKKAAPNPAFEEAWGTVWPKIAARRDQWVDLRSIFGKQAPAHQRLYYSAEDGIAIVFNSNIIPFKAAYPCQHEDRTDQYFVAATTPHAAPADPSRDACSVAAFLDATEVPFFVLPGGVFTHLAVGDIAIALVKTGDTERTIFGVVGDTGPENQIGEASILFVRDLRNTATEPSNAADVNDLDLKLEEHPEIKSLAVLVLGGSAKDVGFDFSRQHVEMVAKQALQKWETGRPQRLRTCANAAPPNLLKGSKLLTPN
jgi:Fungal chitosanase of glycosyl hydrolase group 75